MNTKLIDFNIWQKHQRQDMLNKVYDFKRGQDLCALDISIGLGVSTRTASIYLNELADHGHMMKWQEGRRCYYRARG
jgi:predicted transcriptional regulator